MKKKPAVDSMSQERILKVPDNHSVEKERVDRWICEQMNLTRSLIQRLLAEGKITVNDAQVRASTKLRGGEIIKIIVPPPPPTHSL